MQTRQDHFNTLKAATVLRLKFGGDVAAFTKACNSLRDALGHGPVTEATVRRYCDGGSGYESGPKAAWFVAVVDMLFDTLR